MRTYFIVLLSFMIHWQLTAQKTYYVSSTGSDTNTGLSWTTSLRNIQTAIDKASAGDNIYVKAGTYAPTGYMPGNEINERDKVFMVKDRVNIYGGFSGTETSHTQRQKKDLDGDGKISPWEYANPTILSVDYNRGTDKWVWNDKNQQWEFSNISGNGRRVIYAECNNPTIIDGFTLTGAYADQTMSGMQGGGAKLLGKVTLQNSIVTKNVGATGAGLYLDSQATATGCLIESNAAIDMKDSDTGNLVLGFGGGVMNYGIVSGSVIRNNSAFLGGGFLNQLNAKITDCKIYSNGGGYNAAFKNWGEISNCYIFNNVSADAVVENTENAMIRNTAIYNNANLAPGNIILRNQGYIINCNILTQSQDVIHNLKNSYVYNCILDGGKWDSYAVGIISHCVFIEASGNGKDCYDTDKESLKLLKPISFKGRAQNTTQLKELVNADFRFSSSSFCIDKGTNFFTSEYDLYGNPRITGKAVDLGVYEYSGDIKEEDKLTINPGTIRKTYDGKPFEIQPKLISASGEDMTNNIPFTITYYNNNATETTPVNAGTYKVCIETEATILYPATSLTTNITIEKATLSITPPDIEMNQGTLPSRAQLDKYECLYKGFATGEGVSLFSIKPRILIDSSIDKTTQPGQYPDMVYLQEGSLQSENYITTYNKATLTIRNGNTSTATEVVKENIITVSPNPVRNLLTIHADNFVKATIYSNGGAKMAETTNSTISVNHLPSGIYIIVIETKQTTQSLKFIKQ